eukprot:TRINITY_DN9175_c0_g1_i1.p1 TRINITY_DN9175_c0_g1~~TRINITY_DN9175_c0_g1_i1.p1  ORF type:complete len:140 (+),score=20.42 TRINITY_DN9175_c0_g1_i1:157-576(+)
MSKVENLLITIALITRILHFIYSVCIPKQSTNKLFIMVSVVLGRTFIFALGGITGIATAKIVGSDKMEQIGISVIDTSLGKANKSVSKGILLWENKKQGMYEYKARELRRILKDQNKKAENVDTAPNNNEEKKKYFYYI